MDRAVQLVKALTIAGIIGLLVTHAGDVGKLATALVEILRRAMGVANG